LSTDILQELTLNIVTLVLFHILYEHFGVECTLETEPGVAIRGDVGCLLTWEGGGFIISKLRVPVVFWCSRKVIDVPVTPGCDWPRRLEHVDAVGLVIEGNLGRPPLTVSKFFTSTVLGHSRESWVGNTVESIVVVFVNLFEYTTKACCYGLIVESVILVVCPLSYCLEFFNLIIVPSASYEHLQSCQVSEIVAFAEGCSIGCISIEGSNIKSTVVLGALGHIKGSHWSGGQLESSVLNSQREWKLNRSSDSRSHTLTCLANVFLLLNIDYKALELSKILKLKSSHNLWGEWWSSRYSVQKVLDIDSVEQRLLVSINISLAE
jgi:hypothetical protein